MSRSRRCALRIIVAEQRSTERISSGVQRGAASKPNAAACSSSARRSEGQRHSAMRVYAPTKKRMIGRYPCTIPHRIVPRAWAQTWSFTDAANSKKRSCSSTRRRIHGRHAAALTALVRSRPAPASASPVPAPAVAARGAAAVARLSMRRSCSCFSSRWRVSNAERGCAALFHAPPPTAVAASRWNQDQRKSEGFSAMNVAPP